MKPYEIDHCNVSRNGTKDVVVDIDLTDEDRKKIYEYHISNGGEDYDVNDVSMLVWIYFDKNGNINGYSYDEACYYPAEQGEMHYDNKFLPDELEEQCIEFVKENYIGYEKMYDC